MRERLGELLVRLQVVSPQMLSAALKAQMIYGGRVGTNLVELGYLEIDALAVHLSTLSGCPVVTQDELERIPELVLQKVKTPLAQKLMSVPFAITGKRLSVAMCDPQSPAHLDELSFATGMRIVPFVCPELRAYYSLERWYGVKREARYIRLAPERPASLPAVRPPAPHPTASLRSSDSGLFGKAGSHGYLSEQDQDEVAPAPVDPAAGEVAPPAPFAALGVAVEAETVPPSPTQAPRALEEAPAPDLSAPTGLFAACVREEGVAGALLDSCARVVSRTLIWVERLGTVLLWRGCGQDADSSMLASLRLELGEPSMFSLALSTRATCAVTSVTNSADELLFTSLPEMPRRAAVVPIFRGHELILFLYVDNGSAELSDATLTTLEEKARQAGEALQRIARLRAPL